MATVHAIDVGFGNTKYINMDWAGSGDIPCDMFPSIAPVSAGKVVRLNAAGT